MDGGVPENFGNYLLAGRIEEIGLPEAVSWWPLAPGWYGLFLLMVIGFGWYGIETIRRYRRNQFRRDALQHLTQIRSTYRQDPGSLVFLPVLLKAAALRAFPRSDIAALSGEAWLTFLDRHHTATKFTSAPGGCLLDLAYKPQRAWTHTDSDLEALFDMIETWIGSVECGVVDG